MGNIPLCLIVDGLFPTKELEDAYEVIIINKLNVKDENLKVRSFGYGLTKMVAFWESPWKKFLYLDADAIAWGDLSILADFENYDMVADLPKYAHSAEEVSTWFFDVEKIKNIFPKFDWRSKQFFCTGVFFAKRDCLDINKYLYLLDLMKDNPGLFKCGEQGLLNLMVFMASDEGQLKLCQKHIQTIVPDSPVEKLEELYPVSELSSLECHSLAAIHWCGRKPFAYRKKVYSSPMTYFRRKFLHDSKQYMPLVGDLKLHAEDFNVYRHKVLNRAFTLFQDK